MEGRASEYQLVWRAIQSHLTQRAKEFEDHAIDEVWYGSPINTLGHSANRRLG